MKTMIDVMKKLTLWQPQLSMNLRKGWKKWKCFLWKLKKVQIKSWIFAGDTMGTKDKTIDVYSWNLGLEFLSVCLRLDLWQVLVNLVSIKCRLSYSIEVRKATGQKGFK